MKYQDSAGIILVDARAGINAEENYKNEHLKGARYVDLNRDLATVETDPANGGRHPLPSFEKFAEVLSKLGICLKVILLFMMIKMDQMPQRVFGGCFDQLGTKKFRF
ncbi:hypothetical protein [Flavobacterium sp. N1736]|uniref:hypothetical protein n=1 Tax=Flavobacterium sp. N1736 TaxID=2986823 RepID=UPI0029CAC1F3|nr:hypothetical protein [Flavobacterium sp. N1736]